MMMKQRDKSVRMIQVILFCFIASVASNAFSEKAKNNFGIKEVGISADFNRDGVIEFSQKLTKNNVRTDLNTKDKPFVFWINNDNDDPILETRGYDAEVQVDDSDEGDEQPDHYNEVIDGSRDLIDFFAVGLDLHDYLTTENIDKKKFILIHEDEAVNVVYTTMSRGQVANNGLASDYLKNITMSDVRNVFGDWQTNGALNKVPVHTVFDNGTEIPKEFINLIKEDKNKGVILLEGNSESTKPLKLVVKDENNNVIVDAELPLRIAQVRNMYLNVSLRNDNRFALSTKWGGDAIPSLTSIADSLTAQENSLATPDTLDKRRRFMHIHGFIVDEVEAEAELNETFKRLFHSGSNMLFTGFTWKGNESEIPIIAKTVSYWENVENAFYTADDLAAVVNTLITGDKKIFLVHSLGNIVAGTAIQDFGMEIDQYFMLNPAVAVEAYDSRQEKPKQMGHFTGDGTLWDKFYDDTTVFADTDFKDKTKRRLWSTEWHHLFPEGDARKKLTWRNRFDEVTKHPGVVQYYSIEDEVLQQDDIGLPEDSIFEGIEGIDNNAWSVQEKSKGSDLLQAVLQAGVTSAGWGFGTNYQSPDCNPDFEVCETNALMDASTAFALTNEQLQLNPIFKPSVHSGLINPTSGSAIAERNHPYILAFEIPALSFGVGSTKLDVFDNELPRPVYDMNESDHVNGWPYAERGITDNIARWLHSDFKDVSYLYTHKVFDDMVEKGAMK